MLARWVMSFIDILFNVGIFSFFIFMNSMSEFRGDFQVDGEDLLVDGEKCEVLTSGQGHPYCGKAEMHFAEEYSKHALSKRIPNVPLVIYLRGVNSFRLFRVLTEATIAKKKMVFILQWLSMDL